MQSDRPRKVFADCNIPNRSPAGAWPLKYAWAIVAGFLGLAFSGFFCVVFFFHERLTSHQHGSNNKYSYALFNVFHVLGLIYLPASEFLANYYCGTKPDVSEVNDIFGTGVYLSWILTAVGSFLQYRDGCAGLFWPGPRYQRLRHAASGHDEQRPQTGRYRVTEMLQDILDSLGVEGSTFLLTTVGMMAYYVVKVRQGVTGPVVDAPARVLLVACVLTCYLVLGSNGYMGTRLGKRLGIWMILHLACCVLVSWGTASLDPSYLSYFLLVSAFPLCLFILASFGLGGPYGELYDGEARAPPGVLVSWVLFVNMCILIMLGLRGRQTAALGDEASVSGIRQDCRYWYSLVPPSSHGLDQWGQGLALAVSLIGISARLLHGAEVVMSWSFRPLWTRLSSKMVELGLGSTRQATADILMDDLR